VTLRGWSAITVLLLVGLLSAANGEFRRDWESLQDSLRQMHPRFRAAWPRDHGLAQQVGGRDLSSDSGPLRLVGRWSLGPAYDVDCRMTPTDTIVALARGSGVSLVRYSRAGFIHLELLADINCDYLATEVLVQDSLLLVASAGIEVYDVSDPVHPTRRSRIETDLLGFDAMDTLLYVIGYDSFKVFSVADPASPRLVGACRDSGASVSVAGSTAYVANASGLYAIDVSNPALPHRVGSWGTSILSVSARGNICCVTQNNPNQPTWLRFTILNAANPAAMVPLGSLDSAGGNDIHLESEFAFLSGYYTGGHEFRIIDIADSTNPIRVGTCATLGNNFGVWGSSTARFAFVADDYGGLDVIDASNLNLPRVDTVALRVGFAKDISTDGSICYVASEMAGLKVLDITDPTELVWIGDLDTAYDNLTSWAVAARDSFAFTDWRYPYLRSVDVSDPAAPCMAGSCQVTAHPEDMLLRDSLLYIAEDGVFQIANIARPREPRVVGTCALPERSRELILSDTLAYIANLFSAIVVSVARPAVPEIVGSWPGRVNGIDLADTLLYVVSPETLWALNVANPRVPVTIGFVPVERYMHDVVVVDTIAYCVGWSVQAVSVADPRNMTAVGRPWPPVNWVRRAVYVPPYLYLCCTDGGLCVSESLQTALVDALDTGRAPTAGIEPSVTTGWIRFCLAREQPVSVSVSVYAASGARYSAPVTCGDGGRSGAIDLSCAPGGVYLLRLETDKGSYSAKVVKTTGR